MNKFNPKIDKNPVPVDELYEGKIILAKVKFNSKRITFQPCRVLTGEIVPNHNNYPVVQLEVITPNSHSGGPKTFCYVRELHGAPVIIDAKDDWDALDSWKRTELKKLEAERDAINDKINLLISL